MVHEVDCTVSNWEAAGNDAHHAVLAELITGLSDSQAVVICEGSLLRSNERPPDIVVVHPVVGVHVVEVKGFDIGKVESIEPGMLLKVRYRARTQRTNPITQVSRVMFDIKHMAEREFRRELTIPFSRF